MATAYVKEGEHITLKNDTGGAISQNGLYVFGGGKQAVGLVVGIDPVNGSVSSGVMTLADATFGAEVAYVGVINVAKAAVAITQGDPVYITTGTAPAATNVPTLANYFLGFAAQTVASGAATVDVQMKGFNAEPPRYVTDATTTIAITAAALLSPHLTVFTSSSSAIAMSIPAAASHLGKHVTVVHSAGTSAITITPASGTIGGGATHTGLDAAGDRATYHANGTAWTIAYSTIA